LPDLSEDLGSKISNSPKISVLGNEINIVRTYFDYSPG